MPDNKQFFAFTTKYDGLSNKLMNDVTIIYNDKRLTVKALWDTGASATCISEEVAEELSMISTGKRITNTAGGIREADTYLIDVALPNNVNITELQVSDSTIGNQGLGMLVGMDIIGMGDFAVSNYNGKTFFSFRFPSKSKTDYAEEINIANLTGTHGKGKKRKRK